MEDNFVYVAETYKETALRIYRMQINPLDEDGLRVEYFTSSFSNNTREINDHNNPLQLLALDNLLRAQKRDQTSLLQKYNKQINPNLCISPKKRG